MFKRVPKWLVAVFALVVIATAAVKFQEARQLSGGVRDAETNQPLVGAAISAAGQVTSTDAQGKFVVAIPRGKFTVAADADGYARAQTDVDSSDWMRRDVAANFTLTANRIAGVVRDAETNQPLANLQILAGGKTFTTNAGGLFELRAIKMGTPVLVRASGYQPAAVVFDNQPAFDLALLPNVVNIAVNDQYTNKPIPKTQVQVGDQTIASDADGRAALRRVRAGISIRASAPGYETATTNFSGNDLNSSFNIQFALRPTTLDGTVTDATNGQPISNATVVISSTLAATNAQGAYHLDNVPANASLTVLAPGYSKTRADVKNTTKRDVKLSPFLVKGVHIPFSTTPDRFRELTDLVDKTELNALVLDVKGEKGHLLWDSQVPIARQIGAPYLGGLDLNGVVKTCRAKKIYCIARMPVFQDTLLAESRPDLAIRYTNGAVYSENGAAWTNAFNPDVWAYNIALAKEVAVIGFDEIQFDYVRFPGHVGGINLGADNSEEARVGAVRGFLSRAQKELRPTGVFISADVFGLTTATDDDQQIGQRLRDVGPYLDYVSPMVYPDTWGDAFDLLKSLGITKCTDAARCPYDVIYNSYKRAAEKTNTKVRLWLQAYPGKGDFGIAEYKLQKKAAQDAGSAGWMFWNVLGSYDPKIFGPPE